MICEQSYKCSRQKLGQSCKDSSRTPWPVTLSSLSRIRSKLFVHYITSCTEVACSLTLRVHQNTGRHLSMSTSPGPVRECVAKCSKPIRSFAKCSRLLHEEAPVPELTNTVGDAHLANATPPLKIQPEKQQALNSQTQSGTKDEQRPWLPRHDQAIKHTCVPAHNTPEQYACTEGSTANLFHRTWDLKAH